MSDITRLLKVNKLLKKRLLAVDQIYLRVQGFFTVAHLQH
mgnify:CR=1 FL=1